MLFTQAAKLEPRFCSGDYRPFLATPKLQFPCSFVTKVIAVCLLLYRIVNFQGEKVQNITQTIIITKMGFPTLCRRLFTLVTRLQTTYQNKI
jgi:hypothetical protein